MENIYQKLASTLKANRKIGLLSAYTAAEVHKELLEEDGGPWEQLLTQAYAKGIPSFVREGENLTVIEPFSPESRLVILGGGHIALPLVEFGSRLGFSIVVVDDRPSFANEGRFPSAQQVCCGSFEDVIPSLRLNAFDYVVIVTRGHRHDTTCLRMILQGEEPGYIGMIGSRRRVAAVKELLAKEGIREDRLARVCTPIGLSIGAVTPEEIAVSIVAQLICFRRLGSDQPERHRQVVNRSDFDQEVLDELAREDRGPMAMATILSSQGSVPRGAGAKMLITPWGTTVGSIGGGCAEAGVIREALDLIGTGGWKIYQLDLTGSAEDEGMVCGGIMEVLLEDVPQ